MQRLDATTGSWATLTAAAEAEARWRDHPLDAIALIRASINYDTEGEETITRFADTDHFLRVPVG